MVPDVSEERHELQAPSEGATEDLVITHHEITVGGATLTYTAAAGYLTVREEAGITGPNPPSAANIFVTAYTVPVPANAPSRPVIFSGHSTSVCRNPVA